MRRFSPAGASAPAPVKTFDPRVVRAQFPIFREPREKPLVYLDSAATSQKPEVVIEAMDRYYRTINANIHRGVYRIAEEATAAYENARRRVARFIGGNPRELVFTRNSTEALNLVAYAYGRWALKPGDAILLTPMEHHSNLVPWQILAAERGLELRFIPMTPRGELEMAALPGLLADGRVKLVSVVHISNVVGTVNPVAEIARAAHAAGAVMVVDASQSAPHGQLDVKTIGADFVAITAHKMLGPTGIGALWGRRELLEAMPPYQGGGAMIESVTFEKTTFAGIPAKFEAGTPNIAGAVGLAAAIEYVEAVGLDRIAAHEHELLRYAEARLGELPAVRTIGTAPGKAAVVSFAIEGVHPHDVATVLDREGVAVRAGHHCAQPLMERFGVPATVRASFGLYNTRADVDALVAGLRAVLEVFA